MINYVTCNTRDSFTCDVTTQKGGCICTGKGLKVKMFCDYTDGDVEKKLNLFFTENPEIEIVDVKFEYRPNEQYDYGHEFALVFYREVE